MLKFKKLFSGYYECNEKDVKIVITKESHSNWEIQFDIKDEELYIKHHSALQDTNCQTKKEAIWYASNEIENFKQRLTDES